MQLLIDCFLFLFFDPDDGGAAFLRNVGRLKAVFTNRRARPGTGHWHLLGPVPRPIKKEFTHALKGSEPLTTLNERWFRIKCLGI
jgi:hypothetical protein